MYYKRSGSTVEGHSHSVKTSSDRHIIAAICCFLLLFVLLYANKREFNDDVKILIGSWR